MAPSVMEADSTTQVPVKATETPLPQIATEKHEEYQYLDLIQEILETGEHRPDR